ncbi:hypothetical protein D7D52_25330 [Nocardia yunnanensis]|uniref:DUF998 domain-containing protein n=1 Tax=Nocardia yunnanensis TaxID=2382165 RepID=A0A386ZJ38_9NOCA|nr:hypothetical protein [Nocardia yunnanensis]AYF76585.1 hypothetical protein D7D52_25330 [Nocardia yunnanensis]
MWGGLLVLGAIVTLAAAYTEIASTRMSYPARHWTPWQIHSDSAQHAKTYEQLVGVALVLSGVIALVAGLLVVARPATSTAVARFASAASGLIVGTTVTTLFAAESYMKSSNELIVRHLGYWLLIVAAMIASTATVFGVTGTGSPLGPMRSRSGAVAVGGLLLIASTMAVVGSIPDQWHDPTEPGLSGTYSMSAWHFNYPSTASGVLRSPLS